MALDRKIWPMIASNWYSVLGICVLEFYRACFGALMVGAFGAIGGAMRTRRKAAVSFG